jgi:hypothetical protein
MPSPSSFRARTLGLLVVVAAAASLSAQVRVAVVYGGDMTGPACAAQLNDDTYFDFTATAVAAAQVDEAAELANYDVVVLGDNGTRQNGYTAQMFAAMRVWMDGGGGVVTVGWYNYGTDQLGGQMAVDADYITPIADSGYEFLGRGGTVHILPVVHEIAQGINDFPFTANHHEYETSLDPGAIQLAELVGRSPSMAVCYQEINGRSVYVGGLYLARSSYSVAGLRSGIEDQLLEQAVNWAGGGSRVRVDSVMGIPTQVAPGQTGQQVSVTCTNAGQALVNVTSVDLAFEDGGGMDVTSEYTPTPDPLNPTTIAAGATETFLFTVDVSPMATLGTITLDASFDGVDPATMRAVTDPDADMTDTWEVVSAIASVRVVDTPVTMVSQGGSGYAVDVTVENIGLNGVMVGALALSFTGSADRTPEYLVTPDPANPTAIAAGATESFAFSVDVDPMATIETITIDAGFTGTDAVTLGAVIDLGADVTDSWDVVPCGATLCGDCTGDGQVTILDALSAAQHSAAIIVLTGTNFTNCNVIGAVEPDPSAEVSILDALTLAQFAAGLPVMLVCC